MRKRIVIAALTLGILVAFTGQSEGCINPPIAHVTINETPVFVGQNITFNGSMSVAGDCSGAHIDFYYWDFDISGSFNVDTTTSTNTITHVYTTPGAHMAALQVMDSCGNLSNVCWYYFVVGSGTPTNVCYVKKGGLADATGASWDTAFGDINSALDAVQSGQIWVAQGTYVPSKQTYPGDSRSATFQLVNGVELYGGFSGNETTMLSENFNDGNSDGWTIVNDGCPASSWSAASGKMVQSQAGCAMGNMPALRGTYAWYKNGTDWEDYRAKATLKSHTGAVGLMFRYKDNDNYYRFSMFTLPAYIYPRMMLIKKAGGTVTLIAADDQVPVAEQTYNVEVVAQGSTLQVWVDGSVVLSVIDDSLKAGSIALYSFEDHGSTFDNIEVKDCKRDIKAYPTILSGDIAGNDVGDSNWSENAYHVVTGSGTNSSAVLDDFTIEKGNANIDNGDTGRGGGVYNYSGSPSITNCGFQSNYANYKGGAIFNDASSSPTVNNCVFKNNNAHGYGGAIFNWTNSCPTFINCVICDNTTNGPGGGVCNWSYSSSVYINCLICNNTANVAGGGVYNTSCTSTFINCSILYNNSGSGGGGIHNGDYPLTVTNCIIWGNVASGGGAIGAAGLPSPHKSEFNIQLY